VVRNFNLLAIRYRPHSMTLFTRICQIEFLANYQSKTFLFFRRHTLHVDFIKNANCHNTKGKKALFSNWLGIVTYLTKPLTLNKNIYDRNFKKTEQLLISYLCPKITVGSALITVKYLAEVDKIFNHPTENKNYKRQQLA